jgi:hypothetical protein
VGDGQFAAFGWPGSLAEQAALGLSAAATGNQRQSTAGEVGASAALVAGCGATEGRMSAGVSAALVVDCGAVDSSIPAGGGSAMPCGLVSPGAGAHVGAVHHEAQEL